MMNGKQKVYAFQKAYRRQRIMERITSFVGGMLMAMTIIWLMLIGL